MCLRHQGYFVSPEKYCSKIEFHDTQMNFDIFCVEVVAKLNHDGRQLAYYDHGEFERTLFWKQETHGCLSGEFYTF